MQAAQPSAPCFTRQQRAGSVSSPRVPGIAGGSLLLREGPKGGQGSSTHVAATSGTGHTAGEGEADSKGVNVMLNVCILGQPGSPAPAAGADRRGAWDHRLTGAPLRPLERRGRWPPCAGPCDVLLPATGCPSRVPHAVSRVVVGNTALGYVRLNFCQGFVVPRWVSPSSCRPPEGAPAKQMKAHGSFCVHHLETWLSPSHPQALRSRGIILGGDSWKANQEQHICCQEVSITACQSASLPDRRAR